MRPTWTPYRVQYQPADGGDLRMAHQGFKVRGQPKRMPEAF
jgi:hypothetical protein